jgi:branched-chain amino acid transport system substrate-binding protein
MLSTLGVGGVAGLPGFAGCLELLNGDEPLHVGFVLPFEGTYGVLGESILNGFKMRVGQLDGELGGHSVTYHREPTRADPGQGAESARTLLTETDVDILVGPVSSAVAAEIAPIVDEEGSAIWLNPNATNDDLVRNCATKYHFRTSGSIWHYSAPMGPWVRRNYGDRAILTYADYAAGQQYAANFERGFTEAGGTTVKDVPIPLGADDYGRYLDDLRGVDADVIFSFFAGEDAVGYIQALDETGLTDQFAQTGSGFLASADTLPLQGDAALETVTILNYTPWKQTQRNGEFVSNYNDRHGRISNTYACDGYDCATVAHRAIEDAGIDSEGMLSAIEGLEIETPRGFLQLDEGTHDAVQNMDIRRVERGPDGDLLNRVIDTLERQAVPWTCDFSNP